MIQNTVYLNKEPERKQLTMPFWAYEYLKSADDEVMSKSVKAYESVLFKYEEYEDSLTDIESAVDDQLESLASHSLLRAVEKIKYEKHSLENVDFDTDDRAERVNFQLPESLIQQLTIKWGIGDHIAEAVYELEASAFNDRFDRVHCKRELINYLQDQRTTVDHRVAQAVIEGESDVFDVSEAHAELRYVTDDEWYLSDSVTVDQLSDRGSDISDKDRSGKVQALQTAIENSDEQKDEEELIELAKEAFGVGEDTAAGYVEDMNITTISNDHVHVDTASLPLRVVDGEDHLGTEYSDDPAGYLGLDREEDLTEGLMDSKTAIDYLENLRSELSFEGVEDETCKKDISILRNILDEAVEAVREGESNRYLQKWGVIDLNPSEK